MRQQCGSALHKFSRCDNFQSCTRSQREKEKIGQIALGGRWVVTLRASGEEEVILEPFDEFSLPPGVMRGLRYAGSEPAHILAILGGTDPGQATWSPHVN